MRIYNKLSNDVKSMAEYDNDNLASVGQDREAFVLCGQKKMLQKLDNFKEYAKSYM